MQIEIISTDSIIPNPKQPRESFEKEKLQELADSITEHDLLHPIIVQKKGNNYQILAGERRWRAYDFAGIKEIPAVVKEVSELEGREISIIENWHRLRLAPLESEKYLAELYEDGLKEGRYKSVRDMARKTGISNQTLNPLILAHKDRIEQNLPRSTTHRDIDRTRELKEDPENRRAVLDLRAKDKIIATDLPKYSEVVKKSTEPVKKALLKNEPSITPELAEAILTIESQDEQASIISHIELEGLTEEKAKVFTQTVKGASESVKEAMLKPKSKITPEIAREIMTLENEEEQRSVIAQTEALRLDETEVKTIIERQKYTEEPKITLEEWGEIQDKYQQLQDELNEKYDTPEVKQRGYLFRNWLAHTTIYGGLQSSFCPHCGKQHSGKLTWDCCGLPVDKAYTETRDNYQNSIKKD